MINVSVLHQDSGDGRTEGVGPTWSKVQCYTRAENEQTINYIVNQQRYSKVRAATFWQEMEKQKVLEGHSWKSLMQRFRNFIMENIGTCTFFTEQKKNFFRETTVLAGQITWPHFRILELGTSLLGKVYCSYCWSH